MSSWPRQPQHPSEPSPLEVARVLMDPWNWARLGLATSWWLLLEAGRPFTEGGKR